MCEILLPSLFLCSCTILRPTAIPPTAAPRPRLHQAAFGVGSALVDDVREYDAQAAAIRNAAAAHIRKQPQQQTATAVANQSAAEAASGSSSFDGLAFASDGGDRGANQSGDANDDDADDSLHADIRAFAAEARAASLKATGAASSTSSSSSSSSPSIFDSSIVNHFASAGGFRAPSSSSSSFAPKSALANASSVDSSFDAHRCAETSV
jgi:hypothetical protein